MTLTPIPFILTSITYFTLGIWIIFKHQSKAQRLYGALCIATCSWQGVWTVLLSNASMEFLNAALRVGYSGIVFIPSVFHHFIAEFTQSKLSKRWVIASYCVSALFCVLLWSGNLFIAGLNQYSWGFSAKAGPLHPMFIAFVVTFVAQMFFLLFAARSAIDVTPMRRQQINWVLAALVIYSFGSMDLVSNYGFSLFPVSSIFTGIAFILFSYAILRHELLAIAVPTESADDRNRRFGASQELKKLGMTAAFPLVSQGELLGYLLLGEKMSEESYSPEDLLLLRIITNQAALAYQRVRYLEMAVRGARTEMLGEIAGGFAHEIKTPLANISLPAELCFIDLTDVEQGKRKIEEVLPELKQRMKDIMLQTFKASDKIEAIRQFSKPGQIQLESVEVVKVLKSSISLLDHLLGKLGINIKISLPVKVSPVRANSKQLEIVFVNLIKNASEAMATSRTSALAKNLSLGVREEENWVIVSVKDSGPGIKRTDIGHLFEAYFTTKGSSGTGMGLFLSHQVIKAHGGSIEVQSEEGKGTEFVVRLPKYVVATKAKINEAA
jgi:signal transduction histidine kinase